MSLAPAHFFNWTLTWRRTSDIPGTEYGAYQLIDDSLQRRHVKDHNAFGEESLDDFYGVNITARTRLVAWFNSHCPTPIGREDLAAELARYVPIDIYGRSIALLKPIQLHMKSCPFDMSRKLSISS